MKQITEYEAVTQFTEMCNDIDEELHRSKLFVNNHGYHQGTAIGLVVRKYREELRNLRKVLQENAEDLK